MTEVFTPPIFNRHRSLYEEAYRENDEARARYISVGARIEVARTSLDAFDSADDCVNNYTRHQQNRLADYVKTQVAAIEEATDAGNVTLIRTKPLSSLLDQMVCIPKLFTLPPGTTKDWREKLVDSDGVYAIISDTMQEAYRHINSGKSDVETRALIGFVNETAAIALENYRQDPSQVGLPTLPYDDILRKRDMNAFLCQNGKNSTRHCQVKSHELGLGARVLNQQGLLIIGGIALGNSTASEAWPEYAAFQTSEAIIAQNDGTLDDVSETILASIADGMCHAVRSGNNFVQLERRKWRDAFDATAISKTATA